MPSHTPQERAKKRKGVFGRIRETLGAKPKDRNKPALRQSRRRIGRLVEEEE